MSLEPIAGERVTRARLGGAGLPRSAASDRSSTTIRPPDAATCSIRNVTTRALAWLTAVWTSGSGSRSRRSVCLGSATARRREAPVRGERQSRQVARALEVAKVSAQPLHDVDRPRAGASRHRRNRGRRHGGGRRETVARLAAVAANVVLGDPSQDDPAIVGSVCNRSRSVASSTAGSSATCGRRPTRSGRSANQVTSLTITGRRVAIAVRAACGAAGERVVGVPEHDRVGAAQPVVELAPWHPAMLCRAAPRSSRRTRRSSRCARRSAAITSSRVRPRPNVRTSGGNLADRRAQSARHSGRRRPVGERDVEALPVEVLGAMQLSCQVTTLTPSKRSSSSLSRTGS